LIKFADDSKIYSKVNNEDDVTKMQNDLKNLFKWSKDWQMLFNVEKCVVLHIGYRNKYAKYELGGKILNSVDKERDLGVIISSNLKSTEQCIIAANKANKVLGMIRRNIKLKSKEIIVALYKALVRPRLEYCIQAWNPNLVKDIELLESVQRRATRMINGLKNDSYAIRLKKSGLTTLVDRRNRGDLIQTFKIIKGIDKVDYKKWFTVDNSGQFRGHKFRIINSIALRLFVTGFSAKEW
jgi:hypothetical protein